MSLFQKQAWATHGVCTAQDPDTLFATGAAQRQVRQMCLSCPVRMDCLIEALESKIAFGVWGGLTERERRSLLRAMPEDTDWREWFAFPNQEVAFDIRAGRIPTREELYKLTVLMAEARKCSASAATKCEENSLERVGASNL